MGRGVFPLAQLLEHARVHEVGHNEVSLRVGAAKVTDYAFHPEDTTLVGMPGILVVIDRKLEKEQVDGALGKDVRSKRKAPVVEQVEEMPAFTNSNSVWGNLFCNQSIIIGRYPFISVMEPPMNATRPFFECSNANLEFSREPRCVRFSN